MAKRPSVYTIPNHKPFVDVLARGVLNEYRAKPEALPRLLVLLPNRRSCRSLREAFLRAHPDPLLLPRMRPIGEVEEDELLLLAAEQGGALAERINALPPALPEIQRLLMLAQGIWQDKNVKLFTTSQALAMGQELARFIDEIHREGIASPNLARLVPEEYATHWQVTLDFLTHFLEEWPKRVAAEQRMEKVQRQNVLMHALADHWRQNGANHPVIAAGSTGSIPATARLLSVVARLPKGRVILPGLDLQAGNDHWEQIEETHPQYGLKQLLARMECTRRDVETYDYPVPAASSPNRIILFNDALRPAASTDQWRDATHDVHNALENVTLQVCRTGIEEAKLVASILRETLDTPGKTAALVTHDRGLAIQVAAEMQRYQIMLDDSAGQPITRTPEGAFFQLLSDAVYQDFAPVALLSLLKHPLAGCGMPVEVCRRAARMLERAALRGLRPAGGIAGIQTVLHQSGETAPDEVRLLLENLRVATAAYSAMVQGNGNVPLQRLLETHIAACEAVATTDDISGSARLWESEAGIFLHGFLEELVDAAKAWPEVGVESYPELLQSLLFPKTIRPTYGQHSRLHVLSPLEARLQHYDRIVIGGLNEQSWPPAPQIDPWMSRPMRERFGLPSPERQIGQSAHDFMMLAGAPEIIMTRAERQGSSPTVPSRWLVRLEALIHSITKQSGPAFAEWKDTHWLSLRENTKTYAPVSPPAPKPPLGARPRRLSVTAVETLLRDPYAVYAKHVLNLTKLDPLDKPPDAAQFGQIFHHALENFAMRFPDALPRDVEAELLKSGEQAFRALSGLPAVQAYWLPRYQRICQWLAAQERARRPTLRQLLSERKGEWHFSLEGENFTLSARIDRLEIQENGTACLIDYKTGSIPEKYEVDQGYACQLPLSGVIAEKGSVSGLEKTPQIESLGYWKLGGVEEAGTVAFIAKGDVQAIRELMRRTEEGVQHLMSRYNQTSQPYHALPQPEFAPRYSDYGHLARVKEWSGE